MTAFFEVHSRFFGKELIIYIGNHEVHGMNKKSYFEMNFWMFSEPVAFTISS